MSFPQRSDFQEREDGEEWGGEVLRGTARGRFTRSLGLGFEGYFNRRG